MNGDTRNKYIKEILNLVPKGSFILDIGCGDGYLVDYANHNGFNAIGIDKELSISQWKWCYQRDIFDDNGIFSNINCIIMNHSLEHFDNPVALLRHISSFQGTLIVTVPNIACWLYKLLGKRWYGIRGGDGGHEIMYTPETLKFLLENNRYKIKVLKTSSMHHEFPVSLISKLFALLGKGDNILCVAERV